MTSKKLINIAASIRSRLLNLSKERREDYNYLLILYLGERLLYRLSKSRYQQQFILKGATLFKVWNGEPHRATKDLDFLSSGNNEVEYIEKVFQEICLINCEEDGIIFLSESIKAQVIKEDQQYEGVRVEIIGKLGTNQCKLQVDIGFGDVVTPNPQEELINTILLDTPKPKLIIYPRETVIAEKFQAMVDLGIINSRMKDFYDIWFLCKDFEFQGDLFCQAIGNTFKRRKTEIPIKEPLAFTQEFTNNPQKSKEWAAFLNKIKKGNPQLTFDEVVTVIKSFIMPPCIASAKDEKFDKVWNVGGFWQEIQ
ncbi:nucleotidyl transferase AbiEii/AbiGii toxin family protein [Dolichospermum sp. LEGE 00240]|jgi:predicted nucleotidyltransferase component of viral defense system|uniref:nucleotidyl transferase AbiEii/AbiGii toxin family protein n=1 Tax=Dolichospermum sp. LEGE 00240 TaxID=1828603 RepID=UPI00187F4E1F|nr:nucleotidyl transferase AbiEii/AbiGii toxin family protein [Dolichospermum sp. LEGE 00240]MBE9249657.1 nucleotidyl transferase AbiEii/AbiGii toxin family protein [Dolichospermum sp. LEGE 00240]MDM3847779.1 nucleotidyl transferase AbiEii/AbiGii toxin family protein [Aphanizomenon gracile PMC638.10]MDM3850028.1 nucleotidyl transferase AbiEii/AbiGii toxin family protein [Aphanizomenon gracile PMC627.10]